MVCGSRQKTNKQMEQGRTLKRAGVVWSKNMFDFAEDLLSYDYIYLPSFVPLLSPTSTYSGPVPLQTDLKMFPPCLLCHMPFGGLCHRYDITHLTCLKLTCVHWMCANMFCLPGSVLFLEPSHSFCSFITSPAAVPDVFSWQPVRFALILRMKMHVACGSPFLLVSLLHSVFSLLSLTSPSSSLLC